MYEKVMNLKETIEKEIIKIDKLYNSVNNEVSKFYKKNHESLIYEENKIKEALQNEVTKINLYCSHAFPN